MHDVFHHFDFEIALPFLIRLPMLARVGGFADGAEPGVVAALIKKAARAGFDWERTEQVLEKVEEEIVELKEAMSGGDPGQIEHEFGDVLFALVNLARFLNLNPEIAMMSANDRFERRFREMEKIASETGSSLETADMATLESLWQKAKKTTS